MFIFDLLESISDEPKTIDGDQNFMLFPNMGLEILCLFYLKNSEELFERPEKIIFNGKSISFVNLISSFSSMLKIVGVDRFVEWTLLCKM